MGACVILRRRCRERQLLHGVLCVCGATSVCAGGSEGREHRRGVVLAMGFRERVGAMAPPLLCTATACRISGEWSSQNA
jgi:hypothetical protein